MKSEIQGGVEFFEDETGRGGEQCARCGSSVYFEDCWECDGEGTVDGDGFECEVEDCPACLGLGGRWHCCSGRDWCESHPMSGRASIGSTAVGDTDTQEERP